MTRQTVLESYARFYWERMALEHHGIEHKKYVQELLSGTKSAKDVVENLLKEAEERQVKAPARSVANAIYRILLRIYARAGMDKYQEWLAVFQEALKDLKLRAVRTNLDDLITNQFPEDRGKIDREITAKRGQDLERMPREDVFKRQEISQEEIEKQIDELMRQGGLL